MAIDVSAIEADLSSVLGKVNLPLLISAAQSLVAAWPAVEQAIESAETEIPSYVAAIKVALTGETPTDTNWQDLDASLDAGDADIAAAGAAAQAELDKRGT